MTTILNRDEKLEDDDEPLSNLAKPGRAKRSVERQSVEDSSDDDEPLSDLVKPGKAKRSEETHVKELSDDDQPLTTMIKKKKRNRPDREKLAILVLSNDSSDDEPLTELVRKKKKPQMKQAVVLLEKMSKEDVMDLIAQKDKCSQKGKSTTRSAISLPENEVESSDDEPLSQKLKRLKEKNKRARDRKAKADASSDDEPLVKWVKTVKVKDKSRKRTSRDKDPVEQGV
ncbi:uncharacterized protein LOC134319346 isoform X2 [Trichomycterus rosablanca]|uniref:uncharacterized protein LOC134319346 isoform X2 n=1 Tax=Trichomycterus rosablanca TaxID=2290929 RepID=UPI002F3577B1